MPDHFTDEEVEALKAGLEGVTPGPWYRDGALVYALDDTEVCNRFSAGVQRGWISRGRYDDIHKRTSDEECEATAAHFQRCSPDAIRRLLARLEQGDSEQESVMDWQPIETAPKDGTRILAVGKAYQELVNDGFTWITADPAKPMAEGFVTIVSWHEGWYDKEVDCGDGTYRKERTLSYSYWKPHAHSFFPTHWMPLPAPRTESAQKPQLSTDTNENKESA